MGPDLTVFAIAAGIAAAVGLLGAWLAALGARRSPAWATLAAPLVVVASVASGVSIGVWQMRLEGSQLQLVAVILAASGTVALVVGATVASQLRSADRRRVQDEEARRAEAELDAGRRELIAWVSHDLRSPLASIRAMSEALSDGVAPDPASYYERITAEADRTAAMVTDLLTLTSLQAGTVKLDDDLIDLFDLVSDAVATVRPIAAARTVEIAATCAPGVLVRGDTRQLARAVTNLTINAVRYTEPRTTVRIEAWAAAERGFVRVSDECGGIATADLGSVMTPGWRSSAARTPESGTGAGLGLAVVEAVAMAHHGSVSVRNVSGGCEFVLSVPARRSTVAAPL